MDTVQQFQHIAEKEYCGQTTIIRASGKWFTAFGVVDSPRESLGLMAEGDTLEESIRMAIDYGVSADSILVADELYDMCFEDFSEDYF